MHLIYTIVYFIAVVLSGALVSIWVSAFLGDSFQLPLLVWVSTWLLEFYFFRDIPPHRSRDWVAHIAGVCTSLLGVVIWLILSKQISFLLNRNIQIACALSINLLQIGSLYLLSSPEYRRLIRE